MFSRVGLHACNSSAFRLPLGQAAFKAGSVGAVKRAASQHRSVTSLATALHNSTRTRQSSSPSFLLFIAGGTSLFAYSLNSNPLRCDPTTQSARPYAEPHTVSVQGPGSAKLTRRNEEPAIESSVDLKSLSFGAVAGISTGIFIKKGLKALGFLLGGTFVLLQYLASKSLVNVDWKTMASRYDSTIDKVAGPGTGSRVARLSNSILDFLTADFPPRATFAAGVVLGLRIG